MSGDAKQRLHVLLTGGSGLVGRRLTPLLTERHDVTHLEMADPGDGLPCIEGDLRDPELVAQACQGMDAIVHVAALHGAAWQAAGDHALFQINVTGTHNILEGARMAGVRRVVFTSSINATGRAPMPPPYLPIDEDLPREPMDLYGLSKKLGEQMCLYAAQRYGLSIICLRPGWIAPEDAPLDRQLTKLFHGVDVRDVAQAHALAVDAPTGPGLHVAIVAADSPLCAVDPMHYFADPHGILDGFYPGIRQLFADGVLSLPGQQEWHSIDRTRCLLGYEPGHNFTWPQPAEDTQ